MAITLDAVLALKTKQAQNNAKLTKEEVRKLKEELERTRQEAQATERSIRKMGGTTARLGRLSGQLSGSLGRTTGVLGRLSPGLAEAAILTSDLADATEVATAGGASLLRVLGPVAVAVGAAGAAYAILNSQLKAAEERQKKAAATLATMTELHRQSKEVALQAALARGELTQAEFDAQVSAQNAQQVFQARIQGLQTERMEITKSIQAIEARKAALESGGQTVRPMSFGMNESPGSVDRAFERNDAQINSLNSELEKMRAQIQGVDSDLERARTNQASYEQNLNDIASAADSTSNATSTLTDLTDAATDSARSYARELEKVRTSLSGIGEASAEAFSDQWLADLDAVITEAISLASRDNTRSARFQGATAALSTGGDPLALLGLAGPVGQAAAAGIGGLAQLGGMTDEQLDDMFTGLANDIVGGVERLPELLTVLIPEFVNTLVTDLPPALAGAIVDAFAASFPALGNAADRQARRADRREGLGGFGDILGGARKFGFALDVRTIRGLQSLLSGDGFGSGFTGNPLSFGGGRDSGGTIPRDGLYMLHQGEQILRTSGIGSNGSLSAAGMNGRLLLQIAAPASLPTIQNIEVMTGPGGIWEDGNG